jgi:hypothetical protein
MQSLHGLAAELAGVEEWDERTVVDALRHELESDSPRFLADARGAWEAPYLDLEFIHEDGTTLKVIHGDGYTALRGGEMDYRGYLETSSLIDVLVGAFRGETMYVALTRDEHAVVTYFEVAGRTGQRLGYVRGGTPARAAALLEPVAVAPNAKTTLRLSFVSTPAIRVS